LAVAFDLKVFFTRRGQDAPVRVTSADAIDGPDEER
jgi:hypothetical protein